MSLFQAREWWTHKSDHPDECDRYSFAVCNIDNALPPNNTDKIVVGTFSGFVRIYQPRQSGFKIDDLMLETRLDEPIIQVECGRYSSQSPRMCLAVLHPKRIVVFAVQTVNVSAERATAATAPAYTELNKLYEHKLGDPAYNMLSLPSSTRDTLLVQSIDCRISVFEAETYAFSKVIGHSIAPQPMAFVKGIDAIVIASTAYTVDCYRYSALGGHDQRAHRHAAAETEEEQSDHILHIKGKLSEAKRPHCDWSCPVGESVVSLLCARF